MTRQSRHRAIGYHGVLVMKALDDGYSYGFDIMRETDLPSGTIYPILRRLEARGFVVSAWEEVEPSEEGRPVRRYYRLTKTGVTELAAGLARLRAQRGLLADTGS